MPLNSKIITLLFSFLLVVITSGAQTFSPEEQKQLDSLNAIINNKTSHDTSLASAYVALSELLYVSNLDTVIPLCTKAKEIAEKALTNQKQSQDPPFNLALNKALAGALNNIGYVFDNHGDTKVALEHYQKSLKILQQIGDKNGLADSYNNIGWIYKTQGNIPLTLEYFQKSLKIREEIGNKKGIAQSFNNIGQIYDNQGDMQNALEYYNKSLKIQQQIGDKNGIAISLNNIGAIYKTQGDIPMALEYYHKCLKIKQEIGDKNGIGQILNNVGSTYEVSGDTQLALEYYFKCLKIYKEVGDKNGMATTLINIGGIYSKQGNATLAMEYYQKSLKIDEQIGDKKGIAYSVANIGALYLIQGNITQAKQVGVRGLKLARELGFPENIQQNASLLNKVYTKEGNYKLALEMRNLEIQMRDSILSEKNMKATVQLQAKLEYEKQQAINDAEHQKEIAIQNKEKEKQQVLTYTSVAGLLLVLAFLAFVFNRLQVTRKQKYIIEQKEKETQHQKEIIQEKHKEITDSINYAERIQRSFLATKDVLDQNLHEYFVFFKPKDVVSGDFYWAGKLNNGNFALCCADSTGHGVPGAIMSILNISGLEKSIETETEPHHILYKTREIIIKRLKKDGSPEGGKDGMDCTFLSLNPEKTQLTYAAANNPVFIVRKNESGQAELIEQKPDKMPVGKHDKDQEPFMLHTCNLQKGDVIYTLTDGMPDQFGGDKGKKYMIKNLKQFFLNIANLPMEEQHIRLAGEFNQWKGELEQIDDVCVVGVRV
ncbi:MAG: tetratricopeptide repeat protein [Bacteroidia bacterium]|jgi:tetratricopeptide (TPR) repeat protein